MRYSVRAPNLVSMFGKDAAAARRADRLARRPWLLDAILRVLVGILKSSLQWPNGKDWCPLRPPTGQGAALHVESVDVRMTRFQTDTPPFGAHKLTHPYQWR